MKNKIAYLIIFTTLMSCNGQIKSSKEPIVTIEKTKLIMELKDSITRKENPTETFNIKEFKGNKGKYYDGDIYQSEEDYTYKLPDGTIVKQSFFDPEYIEVRHKEDYPIEEFFVYYHKGNIKGYGLEFNRKSIGITQEFNKQGVLIKETNYELPFKLSFDDIREIIFKTKGLDIYDTRQAMASRHEGNIGTALSSPYYQIHILQTLPNGILTPNYSFLLDAETGEEFNPEKEAREKNLFKRYNGKDYTEEEWETFEETDEYKTQYKKAKKEWDKKSFWDKLSGN